MPFTSEKGKNPEEKKKKFRNRKREKIETRVGGFEVSAWDHGWVGWLQIRVGHAAARARTWVSRGPGSHAVVRWSGSGVVWLDRVVGSLVLQRILRSFEVLV